METYNVIFLNLPWKSFGTYKAWSTALPCPSWGCWVHAVVLVVLSSSLARWLRSVLKATGVNIDIFKAHSVHGASTTAAANSNVPLSEILKMADWSSPSTFQKFYYKPVHSSIFAHAVLQCSTYRALSLETAHNFGFSVKQYAHVMVNYLTELLLLTLSTLQYFDHIKDFPVIWYCLPIIGTILLCWTLPNVFSYISNGVCVI